MKLVLKINETDYVLPVDQAERIVEMLATAEVFVKKYLGASKPANEQWLPMILPACDADVPHLTMRVMDDVTYAGMVAVHRMRKSEGL